MSYVPEHVHLVGSIGLPSGTEVFHTCGRMLGKRLKRIPDGEPGARTPDIVKNLLAIHAAGSREPPDDK